MSPQAGCVFGRRVSVWVQFLDQLVVCDLANLWKPLHYTSYLTVHPPVHFYLTNIICFNDILRDECDGQTDVFISHHGNY